MNEYLAASESWFDPVSDITIDLTDNQAEASFSLYGLNGTFSAGLTVQDGLIRLVNPETGGAGGRLIDGDEMASAIETELRVFLQNQGRPVTNVTVEDGVMTVTFAEGVGLDPKGNPVTGDETRIAHAVAAARDSDLVIAVVGERETQSGEAKNRAHLDLPGRQSELLDALRTTGKPVVVVLITGRALAVPGLLEESGALVLAFFPGTEAGNAIADVLFGDYNPGGKMPVTWRTGTGAIIEGVVDLAYSDGSTLVVVDFKTDRELEGSVDRYERQVRIYAAAIAAATGRSARAVLMRL